MCLVDDVMALLWHAGHEAGVLVCVVDDVMARCCGTLDMKQVCSCV